MAPRRPNKRRETRMDAAIDAMSLMGFPEKLVRSTVTQLIKNVYGPEGWVFIEADGYRELIERLIADQEQPNYSGQDEEDNLRDGHGEASPSGCSNRALLPCSNIETSDGALTTNQTVDTVSASSQTGNQLAVKAVDSVLAASGTGDQLPLIKSVGTSSAAASEPGDQLPIIKAVDAVPADNESSCRPAYSLPQTKAAQPVERLVCKRRRPCYGWISDDDEEEEEEELINLPPAPLSQVRSMLVTDGVN